MTHTWPLGHAWPHPPQLAGSLVVFTHDPWQFVWPVGHVAVHWPCEHASWVWQACPQAPQLRGSLLTFTQPPLHCLCGATHRQRGLALVRRLRFGLTHLCPGAQHLRPHLA